MSSLVTRPKKARTLGTQFKIKIRVIPPGKSLNQVLSEDEEATARLWKVELLNAQLASRSSAPV